MTRKNKGYRFFVRVKKYPIEEIHLLMPDKEESWAWHGTTVEIDKVRVHLNRRIRVFKTKGTECVKCGLRGEYYWIQREGHAKRYHFALHGVRDGKEIRITVDHIVPLALGGSRRKRGNLQPMCETCNGMKGDLREPNAPDQWNGKNSMPTEPRAECECGKHWSSQGMADACKNTGHNLKTSEDPEALFGKITEWVEERVKEALYPLGSSPHFDHRHQPAIIFWQRQAIMVLCGIRDVSLHDSCIGLLDKLN